MQSPPCTALYGLLLATLAGRLAYSPCLRRLFRNTVLPGIPEALPPAYAPCSDAELIAAVSLVVTVKDTCAQAEELLIHLSTIFPSGIDLHYAYPNIRGCRHVAVDSFVRKLFPNATVVSVGASDAPIAGFLKIQSRLRTKYAVLMHNDAYPMERSFACEMFRALEAHPQYPIAAPQIYESASDKIIVPHGHHQNLHVRPTAKGNGLRIDYDLSLSLLTQREAQDFKEGPQVDFLEDHAFFARSDKYHELLDPSGSFTLEYMDMILNMRARNTSAWYVPTARCVFDVDTHKITWEDLPYLVYKRSEQVGHQVRKYLTNKWDVEFVNTGIWNYVRYVMLAEVVLEKDTLPEEWKDQAAVFYSWFESVGFNRYNGQMLPVFIEDPPVEPVTVSRNIEQVLPTDVPAHRVPPRRAQDILPRQQNKKGIDISFRDPHMPIGVQKRWCTASQPETYASCGLAIQDRENCICWNYVAPFNLKTTLYLDKLMAWMKLPSRAFMYGQMKYWSVAIDPTTVDMYCDGQHKDCEYQVHFPANATILQWSWFGQQPEQWFTNEGMVIALVIFLVGLAPWLTSSSQVQEWLGIEKTGFMSFSAIDQLVVNHCGRLRFCRYLSF